MWFLNGRQNLWPTNVRSIKESINELLDKAVAVVNPSAFITLSKIFGCLATTTTSSDRVIDFTI